MQEDAPSCRHPYHEAKNSVLCPRFLRPGGNPLPVLFLLSCVRNAPFCGVSRCRFSHPFPVPRSLSFFSFSLLSAQLRFCPSSFCLRSSIFSSFFFFSGRREIRHSVCGRKRMKKERRRSLFLSSSRKGEMKCVLSFCFMMKGKEKRTSSVLSFSF